MTKRTTGVTRTARFGDVTGLGLAAMLAAGVFVTACTVDTAKPAQGGSTPSQSEPAPKKAELPKTNPSGTGETKSAKIDNATGGEIEMEDGTKIEVPPGALPPEVDTITVTSSPEPAPAEYKTVSPVYVFEPSGTVFLKPLKVTIPFPAPAGLDTAKYTLFWSRHRAPGFDMVPTNFTPASGGGFEAAGEVTHFSQGVVGEKFDADPNPPKDPYAD